MNSTQTIDVKGLAHHEREALIFPRLQDLKDGESLRFVLEFNPFPLVAMLKESGDFSSSFEKEGPDEWILLVKRESVGTAREDLRSLLAELRGDEVTEDTKALARKLFESIDAATLGAIEQELIREGVPHEEIRGSLCDLHLESMRDSLASKRIDVSPPHPVHTLMEEHRVIQDNLRELKALVGRIRDRDSFESLGDDREKLKELAHHLVEAESHHQREEEVLFPLLEAHDVIEPPKIMRMDHDEFRAKKKELSRLAHNPGDMPFEQYRARVVELGGYLAGELDSHIFKEDNILYQIALQVLTDEEWEKVKRECDKIGYCCFSPADRAEEVKDVVELDLRPMPPRERHEQIFRTWESLAPGHSLRIINDHDPKPLRYQFEAEHRGQFGWRYEQEGPEDWIVTIERT